MRGIQNIRVALTPQWYFNGTHITFARRLEAIKPSREYGAKGWSFSSDVKSQE